MTRRTPLAAVPTRPRAGPSPRARRGTVAVAIVIALVALQLTVAAVTLSGARDQDLAARSLDTARAFYAAEAGLNMALRESMLGLDLDNDGSIGTISDNNTPADDPDLSGGRVVVSSAPDGSSTVLSAQGRCRESRRRVEARLD